MSWRQRYLNPFRLASYVLVLYAWGHTQGAVVGIPSFGPASDAVVTAMQSVHVLAQGSDCTWYGFYRGFGIFVTVFFLFSAFLAWTLGDGRTHGRRAVLVDGWALFASQLAALVVACVYFFPVPIVFSSMTCALLGIGCLRASMERRKTSGADE